MIPGLRLMVPGAWYPGLLRYRYSGTGAGSNVDNSRKNDLTLKIQLDL